MMRAVLPLAATLLLSCSTLAQQQNPAIPEPSGRIVGPATRVVSFVAQPSSIQPGQSVTLKWQVINALERIFIEPDVGVVQTEGAVTVMPSRTTVYTITAQGRNGSVKQSLTVTVAGTTAAPETSVTNPFANRPVPRLSDGKPDLSGVYIGGFDIHQEGTVTLKPGAEKYKVGADYGGDLGEHCLPPGNPGATQQPYPMQIIEKPGLVVILYEAYHLFRVIPTDGGPHPKDPDPTWMGNSVGHWEGDTLVVDVVGFNDKTAVGPYRHTTAYHVVERYHRTSFDKIDYQATIEDPNVFAAPWKEGGNLTLHPEWSIQEYICEENNHDYGKLFDEYKKLGRESDR